MVPRGRSQLVESFVWLVPLARIDRLIALSFDSMDRGAWPFFVDGVAFLVTSVSMCEEKRKRKREDEREKKKKKKKKKCLVCLSHCTAVLNCVQATDGLPADGGPSVPWVSLPGPTGVPTDTQAGWYQGQSANPLAASLN